MGGAIFGTAMTVAGVVLVALGRNWQSPWTRRLGWVALAVGVFYLALAAFIAYGPDLSQD
jgi:hypothetical protein